MAWSPWRGLNAAIPKAKLVDPRTPRWVAKPTARSVGAVVPRKSCRTTIPLLKTRWLSRKDGKRVLLEMTPNPAPVMASNSMLSP